MPRKHQYHPILSDADVHRIRNMETNTTKAIKQDAKLKAAMEWQEKMAKICPSVYSWGISHPEYMAMIQDERKLLQARMTPARVRRLTGKRASRSKATVSNQS